MRPLEIVNMLVALFLATWLVACAPPRLATSLETAVPYPLPTERPFLSYPSGPPPPPTGAAPRLLPTLDPSRVTVQPTWTPIPGASPTPTMTPIVPLTPQPLDVVTPSPTWQTYRNTDLGFSFDYPSNWHIEGPTKLRQPPAPLGVTIAVWNYNIKAIQKTDKTADQLKIEINIAPDFGQYESIENWFAQSKQRDSAYPGVVYSPEKHITVSGLPALRWSVTAPTVPQGNDLTAFGYDTWLYVISGYPSTSKYRTVLDRLIASATVHN